MDINSIEAKNIIKVMSNLGMKVFSQPYSVNLGAIRNKDNKANTFNDILFAFYWDKNTEIHFVKVPGTTDSGLYYRLNPLDKRGTAIIVHDKQYRGVYQYQNPKENPKFRGHKGQEAFRQIKSMSYWRDNNKDSKLDFEGKIYEENVATNGHKMGTLGKQVNKWSAACWGSTEENMEKLFSMAKIQINKGLGDKFSFSLLHENSL